MLGIPGKRRSLSGCLILLSFCLYLQASSKERVEPISIEKGIALEIKQILQDPLGFLWIATPNGLFRYDGVKFEPFKYKAGDYSGINSDRVERLALDPDGNVWVATVKGLNRFDYASGSFQRYDGAEEDEEALPLGYVFDLAFDKRGLIWVCGKEGLARLDPEGGYVQRMNLAGEGSSNPMVWSLEADGDGTLWAGTSQGMFRLEEDVSEEMPADRWARVLTVPPTNISLLTALGDDRFLVKIAERLHFFHTRSGELRFQAPAPHGKSWESLEATSALSDDLNRLWIGTQEQGVYRYDPKDSAWDHFDSERLDERKISVGRVSHIFQDKGGLIWLSTGSGINKIRSSVNNFQLYTHLRRDPESLINKRVKAILEDSKGNLWVGGDDGLNLQEPGNRGFRHFTAGRESGLKVGYISDLAEDGDGTIWVLTGKGLLYKYNPQKDNFTHIRFKGPGKEWVGGLHTMISDKKGGLWLGGEGKFGGILYINTQKNIHAIYRLDPKTSDGVSPNNITGLFLDRKNSLWVNINRELKILNPKTGKFADVDVNYNYGEELGFISGFAEDSDGRIWMSGEKGLHYYSQEDETVFTLDRDDGLPDTEILSVISDERNNLWLAHERGLTRYRPKDRECVNFNLDDGLENVFNWGVAHKGLNGSLFFGGLNGVTYFSPGTIQNTAYTPPVLITHKKWDAQPTQTDGDITLEYDQNYVKFYFAAMDFSTPHKNLYSYKLDGYHHKWSVPDTNPWVGFSMLEPGDYTFRVKGSNGNGQWTTANEKVHFVIKPPFWRTPLAFALYLVLGPGLLFGSHRLRVKQLKRREQTLTQIVDEKTASLRAEKEKTEAQARKLLELDRLKTQFFSNISHEFRTPLTLIIGPLERQMEMACGEEDNRNFEVMLRNARRLLRLINQLLDISKLEAGKMRLLARPGSAARFLKPIVSAFHSLAESNRIALTLSGSALETEVYLDPEKMEKVMFNLLGNAFQFTSAGGSIAVEVETRDGQLSLVVRDSGVGIPEKSLPYIFDRFHQVDASSTRDKEGTGIGLSLVKELVELHHGRITVESQAGKGTCFQVFLPLGCDHLDENELVDTVLDKDQFIATQAVVEMAHLEKGVTLSGSESRHPTGETLLVVDDHPDIRDYIRSALSGQYRVLEAVDGRHGLEMVERVRPDLIISDVMMPNMDGYDMCRALRRDKRFVHVPIIMLTAKASDEMKVEGLEIGANDYLSKPFNVKELAARVRNLLNLREQERAMKRSLEMAHKAQVCMLPGSIPKVTGMDIASFSQPAREVGGDYYDFIIRDEHSLGVVIGDVSGKGMSAALYMTMTKGLVQAYSGAASPTLAMSQINRQFHQASASNIFISLQYAVIDTQKEEMVLSNAGHTPLILHSPSRGFTRFLKTGGMAIGLESGGIFDRVVRDESFQIMKGDTLVFYTDGITEGMNEKDEVFGEERLLSIIQQSNGQSADDLLSFIKSELNTFVGDTDQYDDMTAVVVKIPEAS